MRFIRRARRTSPVRVSVDQRRDNAAAGMAGADFEARLTYDRVLIRDLTET
jgi:hypothetical protein